MSKIEEITEILVNEIDSFEKGISKLEAISEKLSSTKINIDLREYKKIIEKHQQKMAEVVDSQEKFLNRFESLLKKAKVYPNWAVIIFIISFLFGVVSTTYIIISKQNINKLEKEAYYKGAANSNKSVLLFFEKHLKITTSL